ncbi:MAG: sigma-70 family RNA polymerase sigma factor [Oscillospiraceae bacterium]|nr:sigma-70 family RNA polymerase sigma factor [Oscillospiraceae bacterium]
MQNEGTSVAAHTGAPRDEVGLGNRQEAIGNREGEDVTAGAHSVRPQPAEASTSCHSEQSEESASPVSTAPQTTFLIARSQAGDKAATEQLLSENTGLIRAVARRYWGRGVEVEDLFQLGSLGFLKAVAGFDLAFGTRFSTYAVPKIAGEIRRFLRDDGAVKVSRTLKERAVAIHQARDRLSKSLGREPVLSELAEALELTVEEIAEAETASDPVASIQQPAGDDGLTLEAVLTDSPMEEQLVERLALRQALERLPEREARVVTLRYFHTLTQDQTAKLVGVSQVQVSRIEKKALAHLRELLT